MQYSAAKANETMTLTATRPASTDTTAALRASEIGADCVLKATKVDGIYDSDPKKNPAAVRYDHTTFHNALTKQLKVMDATAFSLCMENNMPIVVFSMVEADNIRRALIGDPIGTLVTADLPEA